MAHDRALERAELKARLSAGANLLMLAPRRIGKTWLLERIDEDMAADGWRCIRIDVEGKRTEEDFLRELCSAIEKKQELSRRLTAHLAQRFRQAITDGGDLKSAVGKIEPRSFLETLVESLDEEGSRTLILIDEIALFVLERAKDDADGTRSLLYHLRKLQQAYKNVQWFLTGSIGLDVVTKRHGMDGALLDLDSFELTPFTPTAAKSYVEEECRRSRVPRPFAFGEGAFDQLVQELGWLSPYYLRQVALLIRPSGPAAAASFPTATPEDVAQAVDQLLSPQKQMHFAPWRDHIKKNFEPLETQQLHVILNVACEQPEGELEVAFLTRLEQNGLKLASGKLRELLNNLRSDGYLEKRKDRWLFQSQLVRRFWQEHMKP